MVPAVAARYGGPSAAVFGICRALDRLGVATMIATTDADGDGRLPVPVGEATTYGGVPAIFFQRRFGEAFKWSYGLAGWLRQHLREFDLVHVHAVFSHSSIVAGRVCRSVGVPYIVRPLGTLDPWSLNQKRDRKRVLLRIGAHRLLTGAAAMHYTSAEEMRLAEGAVPGLPSGIVTTLGVDDDFYVGRASTNGHSADPYVLALCRLDPKKGLDLLIGAFHELLAGSRHRAWRLVVAGDGDPAIVSSLKALAANGPAADRIEFRGWVDGADKVALVRGASLFALPSHQENFGLSVAEAMAATVPVLVTRGVNLSPDISRADAGWVVESDARAVADALDEAVSNPVARERRGLAARQLADRFRWSLVAEQLKSEYDLIARSTQHVARST